MKRHASALLLSLLFLNLALPASGMRCARASTAEAGQTAHNTDHVTHGGHASSTVVRAGESSATTQAPPADHRQFPAHCSAAMACSMFALPDAGTELVASAGATGKGNWAAPVILRSFGTPPELPPPRA